MKPTITQKQLFTLTLYTFTIIFVLIPFLSGCAKRSQEPISKSENSPKQRETIQIDLNAEKLTFRLNDENYIWQLILNSIIPDPTRVALTKDELSPKVYAAAKATCARTWQVKVNKKSSDVRGIILFLDHSRVATLCSSPEEYDYSDAERVCGVLSRFATRYNPDTTLVTCTKDDGTPKTEA